MQRPTGEVFKHTDQLVRRALQASAGAPAGLRAKLTQQFGADFVLRTRARTLRIQAAVGCMAAAAVLLAVFLNLDWFHATLTENTPQTVSANDQPPAPQAPPRTALAQNEPAPGRPETGPDAKEPPTAELPTPPRQVEGPKPEPDQPQPQATPETPVEPRRQPGPQVEQPRAPEKDGPGQAGETQANPPAPAPVIARLDSNAGKVRVRYGSDQWADLGQGGDVLAGASLQVPRGTADLWLPGGSLLRFDGEISLGTRNSRLVIELESKSIYADNLGASEPLEMAVGDLSATLPSGVAIARRDQTALEVTCLLGDCALGTEPLAPGYERRLTSRGLADAKKSVPSRLTRDLPARVVYREDFDRKPPGGLYGDGEKLQDGILSRSGAGTYAAFRYNPTVTVLPGMVLRFRARTTAVTQLQLEVFLEKPNDQRCFNQRFKPAREGDWQVFEVRLADFADKQNPSTKMTPGLLLRNFKLHLEGTATASVEIDWVEYVRIQED